MSLFHPPYPTANASSENFHSTNGALRNVALRISIDQNFPPSLFSSWSTLIFRPDSRYARTVLFQSSLRAPSLRGPLAAFLSARLASNSFLLSSRFFLANSALLRPKIEYRQQFTFSCTKGFSVNIDIKVSVTIRLS